MLRQQKSLGLDDCALKFADSEKGVFEGYLSIFGSVDSYGDTIIPGAYEETLANRKRMPPMLLNHDAYSVPIGVWKSMQEDDTGLRVVGELTKGNSVAEQVLASMKHGALSGLSIGYRAVGFEENEHGGYDLTKIDLREGSVVTMPAEDDARIDTVKFQAEIGTIESERDLEMFLRDVGMSRKLAKTICSQFKAVIQRDAGELDEQIKRLTDQVAALQSEKAARERLDRLKTLISN